MSTRTLSQRKLSTQVYNTTKAFVSGSVLFDGSGDYLSLPTNTAFTLGTGDFCIEAWLRFTSLSAIVGIFSTTSSYGAAGNLRLQMGGGSTNDKPTVAGPSGGLLNGSALTTNTWVHLAVVRSGSTTKLYQNGTSVATTSDTSNYASDTFQIGSFSGGYFLPAYVSAFRVVKGNSVYTTNFTPDKKLMAISGTSLLTCQSSTSITDSSSNNFTITVNGDAAANALYPT